MFPASSSSSSSAFATGGGGQGAEIQGQSQSSDWGLGGGAAFTGAGGGGGGGANVGISSSLLPLSNDPSTALTTTAATVETTGTTLGDLPAAPGLFGLIYAGRPVNFDFRAASATGDRFVAEIVYPGATPSTSSSTSSTSSATTSASAGELTMFLLEALPADKGAIIFYALPPFEEWRVLGTLTSDRASTVFRTGWITDPLISQVPCLQIGVAIDSLDNVNAVVTEQASEETDRLGFAQLVARDLFKYLQSFSQVLPVGERLVIPTDALDKWLKRFEDKYRRNPQFLFKPSDT